MDQTVHFNTDTDYNKTLLHTFFSNQSDFGERQFFMIELNKSCTFYFLKSRTNFTTLMSFIQKLEKITPSLFQDVPQEEIVRKSLQTYSYQTTYNL